MTDPLIGTSWKMNLTASEADGWFRAFVPLVADLVDRELFVLPPFTAIPVARERLRGSAIAWGAQDVHPDDEGAHTGDVSAPMLADLGCRYVEVGHSERRRDHGETPALVGAKLRAILRWGMTPILCVGETTEAPVEVAAPLVLADLDACLAGLTPDRRRAGRRRLRAGVGDRGRGGRRAGGAGRGGPAAARRLAPRPGGGPSAADPLRW